MNTTLKIGIILLAIGLSFLVGTIYRSSSPYGFGTGNLMGLKANMWSSDSGSGHIVHSYFWSPRELRLNVNSNSTIDLYIINSEGIKSWTSDEVLKPVWSVTGVSQETFTLQISNRDTYAIVVYNPTNVTSKYEINATLFGYETDLLLLSIGFTVIGLIVSAISLILLPKPNKTSSVNE